ncbi:MAG: hypothetical protein EHM45_06285 [Desulfobacteraceae bacterium]|nr:MAG: hypothetical protein EHM45_06285 [Desulfobacteraceae bacterium]
MKPKRSALREQDLYLPVKTLLEAKDFSVRSEVHGCDITAVRANELVIVELKKSLNLELLLQAADRQKMADLVYCAVPKPRNFFSSRWRDLQHLLRRLELGLIFISFTGRQGYAEIVFDPLPFDRAKSIGQAKKKRTRLLAEAGRRSVDGNLGGSTGKKILTAYREEALHIAFLLQQQGPLSAKELKKMGTDPEKTYRTLYDNVYGWFRRTGKSIYALTPAGEKALAEYAWVVQRFKCASGSGS